jgi:hypothetical protein
MLLDRVHTVTLEVRSPDCFLYHSGTLQFGPNTLSLMTLDYKYSAAAAIGASGRAFLEDRGMSFPLGSDRSVASATGLPAFEFTPDRGDTIRFTCERNAELAGLRNQFHDRIVALFEAACLRPSQMDQAQRCELGVTLAHRAAVLRRGALEPGKGGDDDEQPAVV